MNDMIFPIVGRAAELPYYVNGIGIDCQQEDIVRPNGFWKHQLIIFTSGEGQLEAGSQTFRLTPGTAAFLPANVPHSYVRTSGELRSWWIVFDGNGMSRMLESIGLNSVTIRNFDSTADDLDRICRIMRRILNVLLYDKLFGAYYASAGLYELLVEYYRQSQNLSSELYGETRLSRAIELINSDCTKKLTMADLCRAADLSETHLCRLFRLYFGMRPTEYVNRRRILYAKELLRNTYVSVEAVGHKAGFESASYFGKMFRRYEGISPSEYRKTL